MWFYLIEIGKFSNRLSHYVITAEVPVRVFKRFVNNTAFDVFGHRSTEQMAECGSSFVAKAPCLRPVGANQDGFLGRDPGEGSLS